jgi:hypothetical protein
VDGDRTSKFLEERVGAQLENYEFVNIKDYKKNNDIG